MVVLRTKPRALYLLGKHSAIELVSLLFYLSPGLIRNKYQKLKKKGIKKTNSLLCLKHRRIELILWLGFLGTQSHQNRR